MKKLLFIPLLILCGCATTGIQKDALQVEFTDLWHRVAVIQQAEIDAYGLIPTGRVKSQGWMKDYRRSKQDKFCLMVNVAREMDRASAVEYVADWFRSNQVYAVGPKESSMVKTLHMMYNGGFVGDCKSTHCAFLATLRYYLPHRYDLKIRIYNMALGGYHAVAVVDGVEYDLQRTIRAIDFLSQIQSVVGAYDYR